jgi:hypothetical protein
VSDVAALLPIFPLDSVLLPGAPLPLHIFEPRYRALIADVWSAGGPDGTAAAAGNATPTSTPDDAAGFGIVSLSYAASGGEVRGPGRHQRQKIAADGSSGDPSNNDDPAELALVGTFASIIEVEPYEDGRSDLLTVGGKRFRLLEIEPSDKPYLQAHIEWLPEEQGAVSTALAAAARTRCIRYLSELARLADRELPSVTFSDDPVALSYQVAGRMRLANSERQGLLEAASAAERLRTALRLLRRETVLLSRTRSVPVSPGLLYLELGPN